MRKRMQCLLVAVIVALTALLVAWHNQAQAASRANQQTIYKYLTETLELPPAAACGILANIQYESDFDPHAVGDHGTSYGICQWHKSRYTALRSWCARRKMDHTTLRGQLEFLKYELKREYGRIYRYMKNVSNDAYGAYQAGYYWCYHYERPAKYLTASVRRGNTARDKYWPKYADLAGNTEKQTAVKPAEGREITAARTVMKGSEIDISGSVISDGKLDHVTIDICRIDGTVVAESVIQPDGNSANLRDGLARLHSGDLDAGAYIVEITAKNGAGTVQVFRQSVSVLSHTGNFTSGNIRIRLGDDAAWFLGPMGSENNNVQLTGKDRDGNTQFQMVQLRNGCYSIRSLKAGRYLTLAPDGRVTLEAWHGKDSQRWMILSAGGKLRVLLPYSSTARALTVAGNISQGASLACEDTVLNDRQLFRVIEAKDVDEPLVDPDGGIVKAVSLTVREEKILAVLGDGHTMLHASSNGTLSFATGDPSVAVVDERGRVSAVSCGETVITVTASYPGLEDAIMEVPVEVIPPMEGLQDVFTVLD
ncbi:MAG: RICIN domain-containing protein [Lachnospiraceae bacterium]|nr:RICIN domain-containing protein [Lachnospiraceae bacterium]